MCCLWSVARCVAVVCRLACVVVRCVVFCLFGLALVLPVDCWLLDGWCLLRVVCGLMCVLCDAMFLLVVV